MNTWVIAQLEHNQFDKEHAADDPKALWMYGIQAKGSQWTTGSGMSYADVKLLMKHFSVTMPQQLVGLSFQSEKDDASTALDYLLVQIQHNGNYVPPTAELLRERAAESLARMEQPDYSDVDGHSVYEAFADVWHFFQAKEDWLAQFKAHVAELSGGQVQLIDADSSEFNLRVKGPANYLKLVSANREQKVIMGPYSSPVTFSE